MKIFVFIDASNLFYGGEKSLGFKVDYRKLKDYLAQKYRASRFLFFGGVETYDFPHDYQKEDTVPIVKLEKHLTKLLMGKSKDLDEARLLLLGRHLQRARFYKRLGEFGYELHLKPVKTYSQEDGSTKRKANCDVEMAFWLMKEKGNFGEAVVLSGDGDFLPVLKHLKKVGKKVYILARGERTAKEIRQFAKGDFRDFVRLEKYIKYEK